MQIITALLFVPFFIYAQDLPPGQMLLPEEALPEYEAKIDHARLIQDSSKEVLKLGKSVYRQNCVSCHGSPSVPGSVPNALKFWAGQFQHGKDPYTMYLTLTRGWRMMAPQAMLKPREKYAVIHYIRAAYLKKQNPSQYTQVTKEYLSGLPKGRDLGPAPEKRKLWEEMNYGDFMMGTFEIADAQEQKVRHEHVGPANNLAYKGIAVRLDQGTGGVSKGNLWSAFEHDTLRVAGVWQGSGFIDWQGINFDGQHVIRPRTVGTPLLECADGPGWANPQTGKFDDQRITGLDGNRYGPLPREWCKFLGLYKHAEKSVYSYQIGEVKVLETHALGSSQSFVRHLRIGKSSKPLAFRTPGQKILLNQPLEHKKQEANEYIVSIKPENTPLDLVILADPKDGEDLPQPVKFEDLTQGGPSQWNERISTQVVRGKSTRCFPKR